MPKDWFDKAAKDIRRIDALLAIDDLEGAGFHLQQAAEKYLKGYLLGKGWELERIHDLDRLLNDAVSFDDHFDDFRDACNFIEEFYTEERYPFLPVLAPPKDEFDKARRKIEEMIAYILQPQEPSSESSKPADPQ
ncbi:MAG: HEPN domain-containing protein [candidate division KSB1 bacterium]|nr:HEPN domain-containing protein [candidate division KSB1 bacterium]MDZ7303875.1 HEPN domain-containing protein [candidate division KSB1 bacterium]